MAQHGGKRAGAGRKVGAGSQVKHDIANMAKDHTATALRAFAKIMNASFMLKARIEFLSRPLQNKALSTKSTQTLLSHARFYILFAYNHARESPCWM